MRRVYSCAHQRLSAAHITAMRTILKLAARGGSNMTKNYLRFWSVFVFGGGCTFLLIMAAIGRPGSSTAPISHERLSPALANPEKRGPQKDPKTSFEEFKKNFPKVDYDAPEPSDPTERTRRHNKSKHYDNGRISKTPTHYSFGFNNHWDIGLPALPITQDSVIVVASTLSRGAFLSNDKTGVYTELSAKIEQVLKGTSSAVNEGAVIDISRIGGVVGYSTGEESLFSIDGQNMPTAGKRYLFFLKPITDSQDFTIVTGYELSPSGVTALDSPDQFKEFNGMDEATFLLKVRSAIAQQ